MIITGFTHALTALLLVSRLGDVVSTKLATPTLRLEANPLVRRLGWPFAAVSVLIALVPYASPEVGIAMLAASLLVSASNFSRIWMARALGEAEMEAILVRAARAGKRWVAVACAITGGSFAVLAGVVLMWLSGRAWGYWFGLGIVIYGLAMAVYGAIFVSRVFRLAHGS